MHGSPWYRILEGLERSRVPLDLPCHHHPVRLTLTGAGGKDTATRRRPLATETCLAATAPYSAFSIALGLRARASISIARQ